MEDKNTKKNNLPPQAEGHRLPLLLWDIRFVLQLSDGAEETPLMSRPFARGRRTWRRVAPHSRSLEPITLRKRCNLPVTPDPFVVAKLSLGPEVGGLLYVGEHATSHVVPLA